jgi:hypothetical protein
MLIFYSILLNILWMIPYDVLNNPLGEFIYFAYSVNTWRISKATADAQTIKITFFAWNVAPPDFSLVDF